VDAPRKESVEMPVELSRARRGWLSRIRSYARVQAPPEGRPIEQALYGAAQPILGARVLLNDPQLLREALAPGAVLALVCALYATAKGGGGQWAWFQHFYRAFATLAPLPSLFFANHYARLGALVRWKLGFGACGPREMPLGTLIGRLVRQTLIVAIGVIPFAAIWNVLPVVRWTIGPIISNAVVLAWGVHWVVADAFDDAQVIHPGETLRQSIQRDRDAPPPWFVRFLRRVADHLHIVGRPLRWFARLCDYLALDSRGEISIMERNRYVALGFGLSTAALLATPVLNLLFRPIVIVASSHLLGHLEKDEEVGGDVGALSGAGTPT